MFAHEWQLQRGAAHWRTVVILDDSPITQYLAPEFELFRQLLIQYGIRASIADPSELTWKNGKLLHQGMMVDMAYNRLTDFYFTEPTHSALRQAHETNAWSRQRTPKNSGRKGAKAAYRGDKLTRRVWDEILKSDFVAQTLVSGPRVGDLRR